MSILRHSPTRRVACHAALFLALVPWYASAQSTSAVCESQYSWMSNQKGQSPCLVAAYLNGQCLPIPSASTVLPLQDVPGFVNYYAPPSPNLLTPTDCTCNTVFYSLLSACGACQGQGYSSWTMWEANCQTVYVARFPEAIPSTVSVPQWALLDVTTNNNFSVSAAQQLANEHEPDLSGGSSGDNGNSGNNGGGGGSKKSNVGPIVGGVVGGVGGLALVALGVWFWMRRRRHRAENTPAPATVPFSNVSVDPGMAHTPDIEKPAYTSPSPVSFSPTDASRQQQQQQHLLSSQPPLAYAPQQEQPHFAQAPAMHGGAAPLRPYNPDDPSTFPDAMMMNYAPPPSATPTSVTSGAQGQGYTPVDTTTPVSPTQTRPHAGLLEAAGPGGYMPTQF